MARTPNTNILKSALASLTKDGPQTQALLGLTQHYVTQLLKAGDAKIVTDEKVLVNFRTGKRGRPALVYAATKKGRDKGRRILKAQS